jgi:hypothetical protein
MVPFISLDILFKNVTLEIRTYPTSFFPEIEKYYKMKMFRMKGNEWEIQNGIFFISVI